MARTEAPTKEEKKGTDRVESAISKSPSDPSPFLKELDSITGPSQTKALAQLDRDGYGTRAEGLAAQKIMSDLHSVKSTFGYGQISKEDIQQYGDKATSPAEKALAKRLQDHFTQISTDGKVITQGDITKYLGQEQNKADMRNLHAKDANGKTLLDSVGDGKGGVSGDKLDKRLADPSLSDADRASLERLNQQRDKSYMGLGSRTGDLTADQVKKLDENAGLKPEDVAKLKKQAEPQSGDQQRTAAALSDLTAKPGGKASLLDKVGDGKGGVDEAKVQDFIAHPERHNLTAENQKTLQALNDQITQNQLANPSMDGNISPRTNLSRADLQKMGADSGVNFDKLAANPAKPAESPEQKAREQQFSHLFDKKDGKPSLYDQIKSPDGGVSGDNLDKALANPNLNAADRASLSYLKTLQEDGRLYGKKDFSKDEIAAKAHEHNMSDAALKKGGLDATPKPVDAAPPVTTPGGDMKAEAHKALVVQSGQGYYHVAERLLSEAHKGDKKYEPSQKELKELVNQLRHANGNRKSLNSKEELKVDDAIKHNPALAGLFA